MKIYQATIETTPNNCYVETVIIVANNKKEAHELLVNRNGQWGVTYIQPLKKLKLNTNKKQVITVGRGHNDVGYGWDGD